MDKAVVFQVKLEEFIQKDLASNFIFGYTLDYGAVSKAMIEIMKEFNLVEQGRVKGRSLEELKRNLNSINKTMECLEELSEVMAKSKEVFSREMKRLDKKRHRKEMEEEEEEEGDNYDE